DSANAAINAALKTPAVISSLATFGLVTAGSSVREMDRSQREAYFRWGPLVKHLGFTGMS
ncbi:MAG: twin-arginine translocation pathway signal protein, partial [Polaromonas sp.]|nr:twin-arginine translocation pathway signal protein [Polaromonas sp.]